MVVVDDTEWPGVRKACRYFITNRNPNPSDPSQDQGDIWLSKSVNNGAGWTSARIPSGTGRTQYFPMMDVDDQGWVHVAYYENGGVYEWLFLENARSFRAKLALMKEKKLRGFSAWVLGPEDPEIWSAVK